MGMEVLVMRRSTTASYAEYLNQIQFTALYFVRGSASAYRARLATLILGEVATGFDLYDVQV